MFIFLTTKPKAVTPYKSQIDNGSNHRKAQKYIRYQHGQNRHEYGPVLAAKVGAGKQRHSRYGRNIGRVRE